MDLVKRDVTIADDTTRCISVTIWGDRAKQEDSVFQGNPVVCLKGVTVKEWNGGRSGSLSEGGALIFKSTIPEARRMEEWWSRGGKGQSLTALSRTGGGAGSSRAANAKQLDLAGLRRACEQVLDQPEMYTA